MKWITLFNKIGRLNLSITKNSDVYAIIGDDKIYLTLKYDVKGRPYLVKDYKKM